MKIFISIILVVIFSMFFNPQAKAETFNLGDAAPEFELPDQEGVVHSLKDYREKWVVLYFYPKDGTPGCTTEACEFRDDIFKFSRMNCEIFGISLDDVSSHKKFAEKHGLPFPLLADSKGLMADAYGVRKKFLGLSFAKRQTFLIDPNGNIAKHYVKVDPNKHSAEILADLAEMTQK